MRSIQCFLSVAIVAKSLFLYWLSLLLYSVLEKGKQVGGGSSCRKQCVQQVVTTSVNEKVNLTPLSLSFLLGDPETSRSCFIARFRCWANNCRWHCLYLDKALVGYSVRCGLLSSRANVNITRINWSRLVCNKLLKKGLFALQAAELLIINYLGRKNNPNSRIRFVWYAAKSPLTDPSPVVKPGSGANRLFRSVNLQHYNTYCARHAFHPVCYQDASNVVT